MSDKKLKKDAANPALAPKERKIKELQSKIDAGTYKPDSAKIADKMVDGANKEKTMKKDEMKGEQSEPGDMQMSENAKCKQCGKGEKLCKCDGMMKSEDCKKCGDMHKTADCLKGKSMNQRKSLEKVQPKPTSKRMMKSEFQPGMSLNDLKKAEQGLMKAEAEAMDLAAEARLALDLIRSKLSTKK